MDQNENTAQMDPEQIAYQKKKFTFKISFLSFLLFVILVFMYLYPTWQNNEILKDKASNFYKSQICTLKKGELCQYAYTEITGKIEDTTLYSGIGYRFIPDDSKGLTNSIFVKEVTFRSKWSPGSEEMVHEIPFGSRILVRGSVQVPDKSRCKDRDFVKENSQFCKEDSFRIVITPDAIESIPETSKETTSYSYFVTTKDLTFKENNCSEPFEVCEGNADFVCYNVKIDAAKCSKIESGPHMFFMTGYKDTTKKELEPATFYQLFGVGYQSTEKSQKCCNTPFTGDISKVALYDYLGNEITNVSTGEDYYFDYHYAVPVTDGFYFYNDDEMIIYFADLNGNINEVLKLIDGKIPDAPYKPYVYSFMISPDENQMYFMTSTYVSEDMEFAPYVKTIKDFRLNKIDLLRYKNDNAGDLKTEILYEERTDGFLNISKIDYDQNLFLFKNSNFKAPNDPCKTSTYFLINNQDLGKYEVDEFVFDQDNKCYQTVSKELYISDDGTNLFFGDDFNSNKEGERPYRMVHYSFNGAGFGKKVFLSGFEMVSQSSYKIVDFDAGTNSVLVTDFRDDSLLSRYYLNDETFTYEDLEPLGIYTPELINEETTEVNRASKNYYHELYGAELVYFDNEKYYFWKVENFEHKLYVYDVPSKTTFLASTFSILSVPYVINGNVYVIDTVD